MEPKIWGPSFWFVIHTIAFYYPEKPSFNEKRHMYEFFQNLQHIIPCNVCRQHYTKHFNDHPISPYLDNKSNLVAWTVELHNRVNQTIGKPTKSVDDVIKHYHKVYSGKTFSCHAIKDPSEMEEWESYTSIKNKKFYWNLLFVIAIGLVGYFYLYRVK